MACQNPDTNKKKSQQQEKKFNLIFVILTKVKKRKQRRRRRKKIHIQRVHTTEHKNKHFKGGNQYKRKRKRCEECDRRAGGPRGGGGELSS